MYDADIAHNLALYPGDQIQLGSTVFEVQNLGDEPPPHPGDRVRLSWRWEHTFAVLPQEGLVLEEEER